MLRSNVTDVQLHLQYRRAMSVLRKIISRHAFFVRGQVMGGDANGKWKDPRGGLWLAAVGIEAVDVWGDDTVPSTLAINSNPAPSSS